MLHPSEVQEALDKLMAYEGPILGLAELAGVLGISKQACSNQRRRGKLPVPHQELALGPVWLIGQVRVWLIDQQEKVEL